jgi:multiple sugar transport system substrate-binding protein
VALGDVPAPPPAALAAFKSATGITVNWLNISWPDLQTKIAAAATADTYFADVVDVDWSRVGTYAKLGWMVPLDGLLDVASMRSDMPQLASFTVGSETVGIPFDASFIVTTVNTDCFAKAGITTMPTTLDEYTSDLKTIQSKGVNAHPLGMGLAAVEGLSTNWYQTTANFGGGIFDKDLKPQFSDPKSGGYQALQWMVDAYKSGLIDSSMLNKKNGQIQQGEMAHGQVCSVFADYAGNVTTIYDNSSESTVVGKVRYIPTPGAGANVNVPDGMGIPKQAKSQQAAVKFIEWFSSPDSQADWSGINGAAKAISGYSLPSRLSTFKQLVTDKNLSGGDELAQMFATSARPVFDAGVPPWYPQFSTAVYTNVHAAVAGQMSVDAAVQAIVKTVDGLGS